MKIIAVFKTHFDIGFTDLSENVMKTLCTEMLQETIAVCEATKKREKGSRYVWTMPSWPLDYALNSDYIPEADRQKLISLIEDGQIAWHGLPFTVHSDFSEICELIYGLNISKKLSERFGKECISAKMTDVPGHSWYLPTLLSAAGIKMLHLGCNAGCMPPDVPPLFWWEGPDGSRVLTMYAKGGYGTDVIPPDDWKYPVWLAMEMTNDNIGPHTADFIDDMEKRLYERYPDAEMLCGTLDDFYYELLPYLNDVPVIRADLADTWIHGVGTYPKEVGEIRATRQKLSAIRNLYNQLAVRGKSCNNEDFKEKCDKALHNLLMFDEHTWGCDVKLFLTERKYEKEEFLSWLNTDKSATPLESWNEQRARCIGAQNATKECEDILETLVEQSDDELIVYSNGSQIGDCWIPVERGAVYRDKQFDMPVTTFSGVNGDEVYLPILHNLEIKCLKKMVGTITYQKNVTVERTDEHVTVCTPYHKAVFSSKDGILLELTDCKTGFVWMDNSRAMYQYDVYSQKDIDNYRDSYIYQTFDWILKDLSKDNYPNDFEHKCFYPTFESIESRENGESAEITVSFKSDKESFEVYGNAEKIIVKFTFYGYKPHIDIKCELKNKQASPYLESGHFVLPLCNRKLNFCFDKMGCTVHPDKDILNDCNNSLYCLESFVHAQADNCGITVISEDSPLFSLGRTGLLKYDRKYVEPADNAIYFNLFNNQWGTNFPQWMSGDFDFSYSLITHKGNEEIGIGLGHKYYERPLVIKGKIEGVSSKNLLSLPSAIKVLSLEQKEDNGFLLVLKECNGKNFKGTVDFRVFDSVYKCDLYCKKGEKLKNLHDEEFKPYSLNCYYCYTK